MWGPAQRPVANALPRLAEERLFPLKEVVDAANVASLQHRQVKLVGKHTGHTVVLKGRDMAGRSGYYVLEPFIEKGENGLAVLVQRGWVSPNTPNLERRLVTPKHDLVIEGRLAIPSLGADAKAANETGLIRENLSLQRYAQEIGMPLVPMVILQEPGDGWTEQQIREDLFQRRWSELYPQDKNLSRNAWALLVIGLVLAALGLWLRPRGGRSQKNG